MQPSKTTPKDFFFHLGAMIALYASTIALLDLLFSVINKALPDALSSYFDAGSIIWPISMLIILVPVLYVLEWRISRGIAIAPEKKDIWIRRWRIYLTLFLSGATIAGDFIALINTFLNGEITSRFISKILVVLVIFVVIFSYYIIEQARGKYMNIARILSYAGIVIVLGAIISGFVIVGSPAAQRAARFDVQRVNDLSNIQQQILDTWQASAALPSTLADLNDPMSNFTVPVDPETGASYEYSVQVVATPAGENPIMSTTSFELCATFDASSTPAVNSYPAYPYAMNDGISSNWDHAAGRVCFDRTIDPTEYPPLKSE